jgi:hypothetical protein
MGLLRKRQAVSVELVADGLATIILWESSGKRIGDVFAGTLRDQDEIDDRGRRELLVLKAFCATKAVSDTLVEPGSAEKLLDLMHEKIYMCESSTEDERARFEQLLRDRYKSYHDILNGSDCSLRTFSIQTPPPLSISALRPFFASSN